jgi:hypothetical protein
MIEEYFLLNRTKVIGVSSHKKDRATFLQSTINENLNNVLFFWLNFGQAQYAAKYTETCKFVLPSDF